MFTGIIEELGVVKDIQKGTDDYRLIISAKRILDDVKLGDSIAVNGICLTVTTFSAQQFSADVMPETIKATNLHTLKKGDFVNLERAMSASDRFGGHIVSGHVDGTGVIVAKKPEKNAVYFHIETSPELTRYMVPKGSITVDGISLTLVHVDEKTFSISIIPHTLDHTVLKARNIGDMVNLECDVLAKYIEKLMHRPEGKSETHQPALSLETLQKNGFTT